LSLAAWRPGWFDVHEDNLMVKRPTWILLAILVLVVGAYFLIKNHPFKKVEPTPTLSGNSFLVTQSDGVLQSLRIYDEKGHNFKMQRDLSKTWVITAPTSEVADQALAGAAETQVGALRIVTPLESPPELSVVGLDVPADTMELGFVSGLSHKLEVGNLTPTGSGYYVRFDDGKIYVISQSGIDALVKLLTAPPYPATETPLPTVESTSTPTSDIASPTP
jgi:hypothetical protein